MDRYEPLFESNLEELKLIARGKVRDIYKVDAKHLLIVASDRISAFDVVLPNPIPGKGIVLTAISNFWFETLAHVVPNHLTGIAPESVVRSASDRAAVKDRAVVVQRLTPLPVEAVVRGYLIGSGWKDYCRTGKVSGISLPAGMDLAEQLQNPVFTPSTKAAPGEHDQNISMIDVENLIGKDLAEQVASVSLKLYEQANEHANACGIIIADTKFEFGLDEHGQVILMDEILTPDSSRFWPTDSYRPGTSPPSFDKQYVRDYLESMEWDKSAPGPRLPDVVTSRTQEKYTEALRRLTQ
jgi:phosphoribosylaminoimidazole-succinocarboxamide synthase